MQVEFTKLLSLEMPKVFYSKFCFLITIRQLDKNFLAFFKEKTGN